MRRSWVVACGTAILVSAALPAGAAGQAGRRCSQTLPADARQIVNAQGHEVVYFRDPVRMVCTGDVVIEADSAVLDRGAGTIQLVGSVVYQDSTRQLTADWANYLGGPEELYARGNVALEDRADGSRVTGDDLEFRRQTAERPQSLLIVRGRRPHAVLPPSRREGAAPGPSPDADAAVEVWADRLQFIGESLFLAQGNAEILRGDLEGAADTARFDQIAERMTLVGHGFVENPQYRLEGDRIEALLPGDSLREVRAEGQSRLVSEDLRVRSDRLRIELADGQLERLEAWNPDGLAAFRPPPAPADSGALDSVAADPVVVDPVAADSVAAGGEPGVRGRPVGQPLARPAAPEPAGERRPQPSPPVAESERAAASAAPIPRALAFAQDFALRADSIDARADGGQIREVRAVSRAFGERQADSLASGPPAASGLTARDWIQGDTIVGYFALDTATVGAPAAADPARVVERVEPDPGAAADAGAATDSAEVVLERIVVIGGSQPALSLYRQPPDEPGGREAINFMRAQRIILYLTRGELERVEAEGPIEGLYLDPTVARPEGPVESTGEGTGP